MSRGGDSQEDPKPSAQEFTGGGPYDGRIRYPEPDDPPPQEGDVYPVRVKASTPGHFNTVVYVWEDGKWVYKGG